MKGTLANNVDSDPTPQKFLQNTTIIKANQTRLI